MKQGKTLISDAFNLIETERAPWVPFAGVHAGFLTGVKADEYLLSAKEIVKGVSAAIEMYRADGIPFVFDLQLEAEALGCNLLWAPVNPPSVCSHPLAMGVPLSDLKMPDTPSGRIGIVMEAASALSEKYPEIAFYGLITGPFTLALHLMGTDIFMQMFTDPERVADVMRFCTGVCKTMTEYYKKAGATVIAVVDPMTSQIGPDQFLEIVSPYVSEIFRFIREEGLLSSFFVCGHAQHNIEVMCDCSPGNISIDENIPLDYVRDICLSRGISFGGNLKLTVTLLLGNESDCEKDAIKCIDTGRGRGFIIAPGCDLPYDTKAENMMAVVNLIYDKERQKIVRAIPDELPETEPVDFTIFETGPVCVDLITLDSGSCAPCQYMKDAVLRAAEGLGDRVIVTEYKIKEEGGVKRMASLGVRNIPAVCIDGEIAFVSHIPPVPEIRKVIEERIRLKFNV
jgi:uroporphyrinogen decarboxylase